ncbi:hypothetical protein CK203_003921 [Vitis vinifera]|uniref:Uncharacterized protein n=1 Tax=Vitis vinifera TaxID=29760 RepID=A0A438KA86_VITVI|nr:hypothetical protein CK203_003921 [Vitis vinifera]
MNVQTRTSSHSRLLTRFPFQQQSQKSQHPSRKLWTIKVARARLWSDSRIEERLRDREQRRGHGGGHSSDDPTLDSMRNDDYAIVIGQSLQLKGSWWLRQTTRHDAACRPFNPVDGCPSSNERSDLGRCHVDRHVKVLVGGHMGLDPHNAPFNTYSCVWAEVDGLKMSLGVPQCGVFFPPSIIPFAFCISNHCPLVAPHRLPSLAALAISSIATSVVVHLPSGKPLIPCFSSFNVALNCYLGLFVAFLGYSGGIAKRLMFRLFDSRSLQGMDRRSYSAHRFSISAQGGVVSTSATHKGKKGVRSREGVGRTDAEKSIELLTEWEFRERFRVPYGVAICLMVGGPMSTENEPFDSTVFSNEQFNVGLCFPLPSLFKQFLHFTKILLVFLHPNTIRTHSGSRDPGGLIDMQYPPPLFERAYRLLKFLRGFSYEVSHDLLLHCQSSDSQLVVGQIQEEYEAKDGCMAQYLSKEVVLLLVHLQTTSSIAVTHVCNTNETSVGWVHEIENYLLIGNLPEESKRVHKIWVQAVRFTLIRDCLYRRSFGSPYLKCLDNTEA